MLHMFRITYSITRCFRVSKNIRKLHYYGSKFNMKTRSIFFLSLFSAAVALFFSCSSFSDYPIDENAQFATDPAFLGDWKALEDTDKANFARIGKVDVSAVEIKSYSKGKDVYKAYNYYISYFNRHGKNQYFTGYSSFLSKVNGVSFINIQGHCMPIDSIIFLLDKEDVTLASRDKWGYLFARILNINEAHDSFSVATVSDVNLATLKSSKDVRDYFSKKMNSPKFYKDTLHFYRVK